MFTWVWKLCRTSQRLKNYARFLSWLTGSLLLCGHGQYPHPFYQNSLSDHDATVLTQILISFQFAVALQGTARIYSPGYEPGTWNTILIAFSELLVVAIM